MLSLRALEPPAPRPAPRHHETARGLHLRLGAGDPGTPPNWLAAAVALALLMLLAWSIEPRLFRGPGR